METFLFRDIRVNYRKAGNGPAMVMLHNGGSDHHIWDYQIPFFAERHTVFALDLPGFGESDKPDIPYDLELYCELLEYFLRENRIARPVLMGNCIGAAAELEYALRHPEGVGALVLFNVCGGRIMLKKTTGFAFKPYRHVRSAYLAFFRLVNGIPWLHRRVLNRLFGSPPPDGHPVFQHLRDLQHRPEHALSRWNMMRGLESFNKFSGTFARPEDMPPAYLLWGTENKVLSLSCGMALSRVLEPDRLTRIQGAGHMAMNEEPDHVNALIQGFLTDFLSSQAQKGSGGIPPLRSG